MKVCGNPTILHSPSLVVRLNNEYYDWKTACTVVITSLAFRKPLSVVSSLPSLIHFCCCFTSNVFLRACAECFCILFKSKAVVCFES